MYKDSGKFFDNYIESPDGKIARNLRGSVTTDNSGNIIKKEEMERVRSEHIVQNGESLWTIARKYNMSVPDLIGLNNLKKPYIIKPKDRLLISSINAPKKETTSKIDFYVVKSGDVLSKIAEKFNMSTVELAELNDLKRPYKIYVGKRLKIRNNTNTNLAENRTQTKETKKEVRKEDATGKKNSFVYPLKGNIVSAFGSKNNGLYNDGINIEAKRGTNFVAAEEGVVAYVGNELRGYGTIILIKHKDNWISVYAHIDSVKVSRGDKVKKGQIIGTVGATGNVKTPQLYFSLRNGREAIDPQKYLK
ncbi:MAG: M23 family metallopeptidase [Rickettsiales bacterium]|nr:M23 family metallopeptidase [Rickettsiales bacterium]